MKRSASNKEFPTVLNGAEAFAMFEAMCCGKPGAWFSMMSADGQTTIHGRWCVGWWLCITESRVDGIIAAFGADLSHCKALGRAKTVGDAKEALTDLIATSDEEAGAILASGSLEDARELMRAVIETNKRELYGS